MSKPADAQAAVALQRRLTRAESELQRERHERLKLAQECGGLRSANTRLQALVLHYRAQAAMQQAEATKAMPVAAPGSRYTASGPSPHQEHQEGAASACSLAQADRSRAS